MNPKPFMVTAWISIAAIVIPTAVTMILSFMDNAEQRLLREQTDINRIARIEASILFQEGEITPRSIEQHLQPLMDGAHHDFPQWAKVINMDFGNPRVNCLYLNQAYIEVYKARENCFGKSDREIYSEITGITDFNAIKEGLDEYQVNDLLVASRGNGYCLRSTETVYPWWFLTGYDVNVVKCRYDFGSFIVIIGAIPEQQDRPEPPEFLNEEQAVLKDNDIKVVRNKKVWS